MWIQLFILFFGIVLSQKDCTHVDSVEGYYDLSPLFDQTIEKIVVNTGTLKMEKIHTLSVCGKRALSCTGCSSPGYCIAVKAGTKLNSNDCVGQFSAVTSLTNGAEGVELFYGNGYENQFGYVKILCDPLATSLVSGISIDSTDLKTGFKVTIRSPAACLRSSGGGLFIFFIILLVSLSLYFLIGIAIRKYKLHKEGLDIIPQRAFWGSLPSYIKDGFIFVKNGLSK